MVAAGLVGTPFPESTRPYAKITDHYGRWRGGTYVVVSAYYTHLMCACARKRNRGWGGEGGNRFGTLCVVVCDQIPCVLRMYRKCVTLRYVFLIYVGNVF